MTHISQAELLAQLRQASEFAQQRDLALALLVQTRSRQYIDQALRVLVNDSVVATLDTSHYPLLAEKTSYYFQNPEKDLAGLIREQLIRLLVHIGHPDAQDLYRQGVETYEHQPVLDVAQNLRAVSLAGLAEVDSHVACVYAVKVLGEEDTSQLNCEPSMTAVILLSRFGKPLPIYQFLLVSGRRFVERAMGEVVGKALESLGKDFPKALYRQVAQSFVSMDSPIVTSGVINTIIEYRIQEFYPWLEAMINETQHDTLHQYGLIMMASSRDDDLVNMLYRLAQDSPRHRVANFIEAIALTSHDDRDDLLMALKARR
jgi:hypothetical protein